MPIILSSFQKNVLVQKRMRNNNNNNNNNNVGLNDRII